jgi:DNA-binding MarR family transcriptional regulator
VGVVSQSPLRRAQLPVELSEVLGRLLKALRTQLPLEVPGQGRVTPEQFSVLAHLNDTGGCTMGELAAARGIALNSATPLVERLVQAGLVARKQSPVDRRVVGVALTDAGRRFVAQLRRARQEAFRRLLESLSEPELEAITTALPALGRLAGLLTRNSEGHHPPPLAGGGTREGGRGVPQSRGAPRG